MAASVTDADPGVPDKGLKRGAIGFVAGVAIALDSTAPAYSLAAVIGIVVAAVGFQAPAIMLVAFVPIALTSLAYKQLNEVNPDCGTTFTWVARAFGPGPGWVAGFAVAITGILVIGSLADVAAAYTFRLFSFDSLETSKAAVTVLAVAYIAAMTAITILGIELSARLQQFLVVLQVTGLLLLAVVVLVKVFGDSGPDTSVDPSLSWLNPLDVPSFGALSIGLVTAVFIYWGWESAVSVNEETKDPAGSPGKAALVSTAILLVTYVLVAFAVLAWLGTGVGEDYNDDIAVLADIATSALGSPLDLLVVLAVLVSALAATQTTILPASRTTLSMAWSRALPRVVGRVHPRYKTPWVGTIIISALATLWYVPLKLLSENFLFDTIASLGLMIAFYYAITGYAAVVYFRHRLRRSFRDLVMHGVAPLLGAGILTAVFIKAVAENADPDNSYSGSFLGVGPPLVIGLGFLVLGIVLAFLWRLAADGTYYAEPRRVAPEVRETAPPPPPKVPTA